ncbi:uncharacterized protein LOC131060404 [Cryptomeria japonica]|uniref:uncharacterized protein LOC131060404 n=1 Tax=Cryptomeria japonica TaxID=3369 RepID=UPI0027D9FE99|nr:uncharacterized protein LOC131060404 [Cryptomeria japonica]XP_057849616.2 uncharacterized protein LOC131060404 [Cryptomeria japonica]
MASQKSSKESRSEVLRRKGNEIYRQVSNGSYGPCLLRHKLTKAHQLYEEALDAAGSTHSNEKASCYKNLGSVNWLWGKAEWNIYMKEEGGNEALTAIWAAKQHISKALEFHILALKFGEHGEKPSTWLKQEEDTLTEIFEWVKDQLSKYNICFEPILMELCIEMENAGSTSSQKKKEIATILLCLRLEFIFKQSIKCIAEDTEGIRMEDIVYKRCLSKLKDCYPPLVKAETIVYSTKDKNLIKEFESLKEQVLFHQCVCESVQARCQGDDLLRRALLDSEEIGVELVWDAIDWYRHSISLSKYKDLESEAISLSRIGKVYSSVLKMDKQAHHYHYESVKIALTIMCPHIAESEWYKYSLQKVDEHQRRKVDEERKEYKRRHAEDAKGLQEPINVIKREGEMSAESFLQFIYREHIHPDPRKRLMGSIETKDYVKLALRKAIVAYHPDHNAQYDRDWQVLCEEISKILNLKYENFK